MSTSHEQYITDSKGKRTPVIFPIEQYEKLLADLHDLAVVAERRTEEPISLEEMKRRLKDSGDQAYDFFTYAADRGCRGG